MLVREAENRGIPSRQEPCWNWVTDGLFIWWLFDQFPDIILCQGLEKKEHIFSYSFTGTRGIVTGSGSWQSNFVLIFWIFIIKKSPNASARSFNESKSGYWSCCNGFVSDLMISKSFFWSPAHSWTFPEYYSVFASSMADLYLLRTSILAINSDRSIASACTIWQ